MTDIFKTFAECAMNVRPAHIDHMEAIGVDRHLFEDGPSAWAIGKIETQERRRFQFSPDGEPACVVPVCRDYSFDGFEPTISDLIAFQTSRPNQWWSLLNSEPILNTDAVEKARPHLGGDEVLTILESPLDWLRNDRQGAVVLDWSASLFFHLGGVHRICAASETLARRLERALTLPTWPAPEIRFEETRHAA